MYITYMGNKLNNKKGENMTIKLVRIKNETFTDDPDKRLYVYGNTQLEMIVTGMVGKFLMVTNKLILRVIVLKHLKIS